MCRIAALSSPRPIGLEEMMDYFFFPPMPDTHNRDGWGMACYMGRECLLIKEPRHSRESPLLKAIIREGRIKGDQAILHVRKATRGGVTFANAHPFVRTLWGEFWAFVHHGNVDWEPPSLSAPFQPVGETDTERIFCWMLNELWQAFGDRVPPLDGVMEKVEELAYGLWRDNKKMNFVLCGPSIMLVFYGGYEGMCYCNHTFEGAKTFIVSSLPLPFTTMWKEFEPGELKILAGGSMKSGSWGPSFQRGLLE